MDALKQKSDSTNEYDNFFVPRGALYSSQKFTYSVNPTGKTYPAVEVTESSVDVNAKMPRRSITKEELERCGVCNKQLNCFKDIYLHLFGHCNKEGCKS